LGDEKSNHLFLGAKTAFLSVMAPKSFQPGLPDSIFSDQKSNFGSFLEGLAMEDVGIFYGHLVYFTTI
jgi:hypothetical protein